MPPPVTSAQAASGPKIEALLSFAKGRPGGRGVITNPESIERALQGHTGTCIEG